jgi:hypothetical protein
LRNARGGQGAQKPLRTLFGIIFYHIVSLLLT